MEYLIFAVISLITIAIEFFYCSYMGVFETGLKIPKIERYKDENIVPFKGIKLILTIIICLAVSYGVQISLHINTSTINFVKLYGLFIIVLLASIVDFKKKIIPNFLIVVGLLFRVGVYIYELTSEVRMKEIIINSLIGFAIGFGILVVVAFITKQGIGFGDAKLFAVIGLTGGSFCTYSTLFVSLVLSAIASLVLLLLRKKTKKDSIPFGPCIAIGYTLVLLLTSY